MKFKNAAQLIAAANAQGFPFAHGSARKALNTAVAECHLNAVTAGWWARRMPAVPSAVQADVAALLDRAGFPVGGKITAEEVSRTVPEKLCLTHSELSEAMEGHRKGLMDDKLPWRPMLEVELADTIIRIFDLAGALQLDLGGAVVEKLAYNSIRPDHKPEARAAEGGKEY